jgi:hypothetical protein
MLQKALPRFTISLICFFALLLSGHQTTSAQIDTREACGGSLQIGERGRVLPGLPNNVRTLPTTSARDIGQLPGGAEFDVLDGPRCGDGFTWWFVSATDGSVMGWTAEGTGNDAYLEAIETTTDAVNLIYRETFDDGPGDWRLVMRQGPANTRFDFRMENGDGMICAQDPPFADWYFGLILDDFPNIDFSQFTQAPGQLNVLIRQQSAEENAGRFGLELNVGNAGSLIYTADERLPFNEYQLINVPITVGPNWEIDAIPQGRRAADAASFNQALDAISGILINGAYGRVGDVCLSEVSITSEVVAVRIG